MTFVSIVTNNSNLLPVSSEQTRPLQAPLVPIYQQTYEELVAFVKPADLLVLEASLEGLPNQENILSELQEAVRTNTLTTSPIFSHNAFALYALLAFKKKIIDGSRFTTSQLFYNANVSAGQKVPLFVGGVPNPSAREMIEETMKSLNPAISGWELTPAQLARFFEIMAQFPAFEQQYFLLPDPARGEEEFYSSQRLAQIGFNVFGRVQVAPGKYCRVIPSKAMMQAYLMALSPTNYCQLVTRFQLSPSHSLLEQIPKSQRDLCLNFRFLPKVDSADGFKVDLALNECEAHDFFHAVKFTLTSLDDRKRFEGIARALQEVLKKFKPNDRRVDLIQLAFDNIVDMDHLIGAYFWHNVSECFIRGSFVVPYLVSQAIARASTPLLEELIEHADRYRTQYGIDLKTLETQPHRLPYQEVKEKMHSKS